MTLKNSSSELDHEGCGVADGGRLMMEGVTVDGVDFMLQVMFTSAATTSLCNNSDLHQLIAGAKY